MGDNFGRIHRYPAEVLVNFLKSGEDELLRFLKVAILEMGEDSPDFVEIDIVFEFGFTLQVCRRPRFRTGDGRRHVFHFCP